MKLSKAILTEVIVPRLPETHKGNFGRILCIGGDAQYGGAIIMCAQACVSSGAGLVTVITDSHNHAALHARLPEAMVVDWTDFATIGSLLKTADCLVVGPGMGLSAHSLSLLTFIKQTQTAQQTLILDGSALTLLAQEPLTFPFPQQIVITPHQKEWERLSRLPISLQTTEANRQKQKELGFTLVLKSYQTTIYTATTDYLNPFGNPAMATGGTGDTLAGMIASFIGQFGAVATNEKAICAAVVLHSYIADELAKNRYVVLPSDIAKAIPTFMHQFAQISS